MASPRASPTEVSTISIKSAVNNNNDKVKTEAEKEASVASEAGGTPVAYNHYARHLLLVQK